MTTKPTAKPKAAASTVSFLDFLDADSLAGPWFKGASWDAWKAFGCALFGLAMTPAQLATYRMLTGRTAAPTQQAREAWAICGRRGGKSLFMSAVAVYLACFRSYEHLLKPGQRAHLFLMAADKSQAGELLDYVTGMLDGIAALSALVERGKGKRPARPETIRLTNHVVIHVQVASFRRLRGRTVIGVIADEVAFWLDDSRSLNPAQEVFRALKPSMLTVPDALLVGITSPYRRQGVAWDAFKAHYGRDGDRVLVIKAATLEMNPSADKAEIDAAYADDPEAARAEYGAEFRTDLESFVGPEAVEKVTVRGRLWLAYDPRYRHFAAVDCAGGSGQDSYALTISRHERGAGGGKAVVCRVAEWRPPFSPDAATAEASEIVKEYGLARVTGDHWAKGWPTDGFKQHGVDYVLAPLTKSEYYTAMLPLINSGRIELPDNAKLLGQLLSLERQTSRLGKDSISHPPNGRDDMINSAAIAAVMAMRRPMLNSEGVAERERRSAPVPTGVIEERRRMYGGTVIVRIFPDGTEVVDRVAPESEAAALEHGYRACPNYPARCHSQQHLAVEREGVLVADCPYGRPQWDVAKLARDGMPADARPDIGLRPERTGVEPVAPGKTVRWSR